MKLFEVKGLFELPVFGTKFEIIKRFFLHNYTTGGGST